MDELDAPEMPERWIDDTQPIGPLTRAEVARHLGVSTSKVRRMEGTTLFPRLDARGRQLFERSQVLAVAQTLARNVSARTPAGRIAPKVFTLIEEGRDLSEIVIALELEPAVVRALYEEWRVNLEPGYLRKLMEAKIRRRTRNEARAKREMDAWSKQVRDLDEEMRKRWTEDDAVDGGATARPRR